MKSLITQLFGTYTPVTTTVEASDGTLYTAVASGAAGVDWTFVLGIALFALAFYGFILLLRIVFRGK